MSDSRDQTESEVTESDATNEDGTGYKAMTVNKSGVTIDDS